MTKAKSVTADAAHEQALLKWLVQRRSEMVALTRELVVRESPSSSKHAVDALGEFVAAELDSAGGRVRLHRQREFGNLLQADFVTKAKRGRVLLLGHIDTVYELGTLSVMPWRERGGRIYGPGVFDMKAGIAQMLYALRALKEVSGRLPCPVTVLLNTDEEVGSVASRAVTEKLATGCDAVLVLEPAAGARGACKTARKGVGNYTIKVTGRAAHAGLDFEKGASAITELARQLVEVVQFTDLKCGTTVNPGLVRGGTRTNVVAASAEAEIDVRVATMRDGRALDRKLRHLRPFDKRCTIEVAGGLNRAPFERTNGVAALYGKARGLAAELGFELAETSVGGGSDGNFTAGIGIPTLDGLGAVGDGAHAKHEHVIVADIPRRAALLARLLESM
ncbi:MAG TPA: M20 family metallopeptidase [Clostridia bacterium]|nr:M20 family metallopeptidase [Clostridia bacterium]